MAISPETLAESLLSAEKLNTRKGNDLFLYNCAVVVYDGLILWRGNLNMAKAIPNLVLLGLALGMPVAIIEKQILRGKKRYRAGKHCGPGNWQKCSWDSESGLDLGLSYMYEEDGHKRMTADGIDRVGITRNSHQQTLESDRGWETWQEEYERDHGYGML